MKRTSLIAALFLATICTSYAQDEETYEEEEAVEAVEEEAEELWEDEEVMETPVEPVEMSKAEKKELKKEIKSLSPESYKQLLADRDNAQAEVVTLQNQVDDLETQVVILQSEIDDYKATAMQQEAEEAAAEATTESTEETDVSEPVEETSPYAAPVQGLVYKVQIGAFKKFDITKYFNNHKNFGGEVDADGTMKYTIGQFTDYWAADQFKKYLREMGVEGAWVVAYKDGQRVSMQDAREGNL